MLLVRNIMEGKLVVLAMLLALVLMALKILLVEKVVVLLLMIKIFCKRYEIPDYLA